MKYCSECGSELNGETKCNVCGFDLETKTFSEEKIKEKEEYEKFLESHIGTIENQDEQKPIETHYMEMIKPKIEELLAKRKDKIISLKELKEFEMTYDGVIAIMFADGIVGLQESNLYSLEYKDNKLTHLKIAPMQKHQTTKIYKVEEKEIKRIKEIIKENNMIVWSLLENDFSTLESNLHNLYIYAEKNTFTISHNKVLSAEEKKVLKDLKELVLSLLKEENLIETKEETEEELRFKQNLMG